jgi:hypothetical protein
MPINTQSNAFDSTLRSIVFKSSQYSNVSFDILNQSPRDNTECKFTRLEMEETIFTIYPVGALVVRDTGDIVNFIQKNQIDSILLEFNDNTVPKLLSITSTANVTNAASDTEESFVSINFTNSFYKLSQKTSAADLLISEDTLEDRVYSIEELFKATSDNIKNRLSSTQTSHQGALTPADNFFSLKQLNVGNNKLNLSVTDNAFQYLNYLSSLAVDKTSYEPRFMFWTEFGDYINFKHFPSDLSTDTVGRAKYNSKNYRYSVYNGDSPTQQSTNGKTYKKIYVLNTDPTNQWVSKNYFYVRKTPKFLDNIPATIAGGEASTDYTTKALTFHFQDDGEKYNIELIASNGIIGGITSGADEVFYDKDWGWISDTNTVNDKAPATYGSGEFGLAKVYSANEYMGHSGYFSRADNTEMWKNIFDMTPVHPDYPRNIGSDSEDKPDTSTFYYNQIQTNLSELYKGSSYSPDNLEMRRKIERENFVLYVLCCLGDDETFFANLIRYEPDKLVKDYQTENPTQPMGPDLKWRYKWEGLKFINAAGSTYWSLMELWETDELNLSGATQDGTGAINLNERTAGLGDPKYLPPGWVAEIGGFKYRPIGCNTNAVVPEGATIAHIVKMYKTSAEKMSMNGNISIPPELRGKSLYYFSAENVVDGSC